jgi:MbtH protein
MNSDDKDDLAYKVLVNHEEQYSIWPAERSNPHGWRDAGRSGSKADCLTYVREVWTDMRPLSLRTAMNKLEKRCKQFQRESGRQSRESDGF